MSKTHKLAWAAGFFDGEGYITIQKRKFGKYSGHYLRIGVNHVRKEPLLELTKIFPNTTIRLDKAVTGNRRPRWVWSPSCNKASDVLKQILPYLKNKTQVAKLAIELQERIKVNTTKEISDAEYSQREWFKEEIMRINAKG